eukprot:scpid65316/ scgid22002/ 
MEADPNAVERGKITQATNAWIPQVLTKRPYWISGILILAILLVVWSSNGTSTLKTIRWVKTYLEGQGKVCKPEPMHFGLRKPCPGLPIRPDTILYLVMGKSFPNASWIKKSRWENVSLHFQAWKLNVTEKMLPLTGKTLRWSFFPHSTWTTGRNKQIQEAYNWEMDQGWKFEFFVFFDEDVYLSYRSPENPSVSVWQGSDEHAMKRFNKLLLQDRPFRAGISFNDHTNADYNWSRTNFGCERRCGVDNVVVAMHRTGVELLLPYQTELDSFSWWMSAYLNNLMAAVLAPRFCNFYREVMVEVGWQNHGSYLRGEYYELAEETFLDCLISHNYTGFADMDSGEAISKIRHGLGPSVADANRKCVKHPAGVDFRTLLQDQLENWVVTCLPIKH